MQKKFPEAYALGKKTYELSTTCNTADKWYLISAAYAGAYNDAKNEIIKNGGTITLDQDVLTGVLTSGQTSVAIEILLDEKKKNPQAGAQIDAYIKQLLAMPRK
jgi:hypothetical protein